ncbi:gliding motility lipoprotein GldB [Changchengzhania lutea]|uniref:gliding motility lipoprotein GldB n=1 Tax=Changchengzhania lutea TaxID=2049305 RepID=UPI00115C9D67|nr:gliding motility lipoprotein GldB [Changchengzhania lutea]
MKNLILFLAIILMTMSCKDEGQLEADIAGINTNIEVERFDVLFGKATPNDLPKLKQAYPFMFSEKYTDSFWVGKMKDTLQVQLHEAVSKTFPSFDTTEAEIESLFNHLKYYFPEFRTPRVITATSSVDYRNKIIVTDTIVLISIDTYLGSEHEFYEGIQKFIRATMNKEQIVVDLASEYAKKYIYQKQNKTLLDEMIYFGKELYFKDLMLPFKTEAERIGYTADELIWALSNESYIWSYFVEREMLFSTDSKLPERFINPAPFTKFYLEDIDSDSPGRLGQYIGWQIVRAYMNQNDVLLKEMLIKSPKEIFNNSKFKPRK